jgi:hypothetical protein
MKYIRPILRSKLFRFFFIIYLAFFVFDKAFSIDVVTTETTLTNISIGQLQNFPQNTIRFIRFYPDEYASTLQYAPINNFRFEFYGQPGSTRVNGSDVSGDLSAYDLMMSVQINNNNTIQEVFYTFFRMFSSEPYPAEEEQPDNGGGGGSDFDINDLDYNLAATFFASGFAIFLLPWLHAYGFSALLGFIKKSH